MPLLCRREDAHRAAGSLLQDVGELLPFFAWRPGLAMSTSTAVAPALWASRTNSTDDGRCESIFSVGIAPWRSMSAPRRSMSRSERIVWPPSATSTRTVFEPTSTTPTGIADMVATP